MECIIETKNYRNYCEIDLNAVSHNIRQIKDVIGSKVKIMGVLKADAYGHGAVRIAEVLVREGVEYLAVATIDEALELRENFKDIPILILGYVPSERLIEAVQGFITLTAYNFLVAEEVAKVAEGQCIKAKIHIKVDVGMNRIGFKDYQINELMKFKEFDNLDIEGIYTHFPCASSDAELTKNEFFEFVKVCGRLENSGFKFKYKHCCNSSAIINFSEMHMDMVRPGIAIYGLLPHEGIDENQIYLKPSMSFKARVVDIKEVPSDVGISYDYSFKTRRKSRIATLSVGYADGYSRMLSNNTNVIINGRFAPIVGKICMDQCMADVTDIDVKVGDMATLFGKTEKNEISMDEIAKKLNTINYEVLCSIGKRVPRIYVE